MQKNEMMSKEVFNKLVETFKTRMNNFSIKPGSKKYIDMQCEFFMGACAAIDTLFGNEKSCIPPSIWVDVMRGNVIESQN